MKLPHIPIAIVLFAAAPVWADEPAPIAAITTNSVGTVVAEQDQVAVQRAYIDDLIERRRRHTRAIEAILARYPQLNRPMVSTNEPVAGPVDPLGGPAVQGLESPGAPTTAPSTNSAPAKSKE